VATVVGANLALTSGNACWDTKDLSGWVPRFDVSTLSEKMHWDVGREKYFQMNKPWPTGRSSDLWAVEIRGELYRPTKKMIIPNSNNYANPEEYFYGVTTKEELIPAMSKFLKNGHCLLMFDEPLPVWPACNPLDNGQMGRVMYELKYAMNMQIGHKLGNG